MLRQLFAHLLAKLITSHNSLEIFLQRIISFVELFDVIVIGGIIGITREMRFLSGEMISWMEKQFVICG